jgi:hypothetical protein
MDIKAGMHQPGNEYMLQEVQNMANSAYLKIVTQNFISIKKQAEQAMEQLTFEQLQFRPNNESNSIAILIKHMSGNLRSRFSNFLTEDGEKPDRERDREFEDTFGSAEEMWLWWNSGWNVLFDTLNSLHEDDLSRTVLIRNEPHSAMESIQRQVVHQSSHAGQIVYIAKMLKDSEWKTLSIPRGQSAEFNEKMRK